MYVCVCVRSPVSIRLPAFEMLRIAGTVCRRQLCSLVLCARQRPEASRTLACPRTIVVPSLARSLCGDGGRGTADHHPSSQDILHATERTAAEVQAGEISEEESELADEKADGSFDEGSATYKAEAAAKPVYPARVEDVVRILKDVNAVNVCAIRIPPERQYLTYVVIVSGKSKRHLRAMASYLVSQVSVAVLCECGVSGRLVRWLMVSFGRCGTLPCLSRKCLSPQANVAGTKGRGALEEGSCSFYVA